MSTAAVAQASEAIVASRDRVVQKYINDARKLLQSMSPSDWWNDATVMGVAARLAISQMGMTTAVRRLGAAYAAQMLKEIGVKADMSALDPTLPVRYGSDPWEEYSRVASNYREKAVQNPEIRPFDWDSEQGEISRQWVDYGIQRLETMANTDAAMASNLSTFETYTRNGVRQYRRMIHPELSRNGSCGLCVVASTRVYSMAHPAPLHDNCKCTTAPIKDGKDPGMELAQEDLERIYKAAGSTYAKELKKVRAITTTNGELGPILTRSGKAAGREGDFWKLPDGVESRRQLTAMLERAQTFDRVYAQVKKTGVAQSFSYGGRRYQFRYGDHHNEAWAFNRRLADILRARLTPAH